MATLKEVKMRIEGVKNTQKITKAMKIVAATKLKKHERERKESGFYTGKLENLLHNVIAYGYHPSHPLLREREHKGKIGFVIVGSDRGLCGSFNGLLFRKALECLEKHHQASNVVLVTIGKRAYDFFKKTPYPIMAKEVYIEKRPRREVVDGLMDQLLKKYLEGEVDTWNVLSNRFTSRINFGCSHKVIIPITVPTVTKERDDSLYMFEDNIDAVLDYLVPRYISDVLYTTVLESQNAEELSRMMAMDYATENANDMIGELTLHYNRTRQQVITKELSEIVGGAEALK